MTTKSNYRELYEPILPYNTGFLTVCPLHSLYYEESGNPKGNPVLYVHGGPGGGTSPSNRRVFNPEFYRIILFDQRGSGKSTPFSCLEENTLWDLVSDIEKLRNHLGIQKWVVFGGSWGSTLSLVYAQEHPSRVKALILRGIFLLKREELLWFYQNGASNIFPDAWEKYLEPIPEEERHDMMSAYYKRLTGNDEELKLKCAKAWTTWEMSTSTLYPDEENITKGEEPQFALAFARIESHYFVNRGFMKENHILENMNKIIDAKIPATIVQGRYDLVCPIRQAWDLHKIWPEAQFFIVPDSGHSMREPGILSRLIQATDEYQNL